MIDLLLSAVLALAAAPQDPTADAAEGERQATDTPPAAELPAALLPVAVLEELRPIRNDLRALAESLAKVGYAEELERVQAELLHLGATAKEQEALQEKVDKLLAKAKPPRTDRAARNLRKRLAESAADVARALAAKAVEEDRDPGVAEILARSALRLDAGSDVAHQQLGHVLGEDGLWRSEEQLRQQTWLRDFALITQQARHLDYALEEVAPTDPQLLAMAPEAAHALQYRGLRFEGALSREALADKLTLALRGDAISNWILNGSLEPLPADISIVWMPYGAPYQEYLQRTKDAGHLAEQVPGLAASMSGTWTAHRHLDTADRTIYLSSTVEPIVETFFKTDRAFGRDPSFYDWFEMFYARSATAPPWLVAGHVNMIGLGFYGVGWGKYRSIANDPSDTVVYTRGWDPKLAGAGIVGCRSYIRALAMEERDPPLTACLKGEVGLLRGDILLKATMVVEYLYSRDGPQAVLARYREAFRKEGGDKSPVALLEATLGMPIPEFEASWRSWILRGTSEVSLTDLLDPERGVVEERHDPVAERLLEDLNRRRYAAELQPVYLDAELSEGCRKHAAYLRRHPERASLWPDVHEQTMEHVDFSTEGSWAAGHSVIAFAGPKRCLDDWLGSFYHRLPLLEPMLVGIGFGQEQEVCVLDAGSLVNRTGGWAQPYPHHGMRDVPRRFAPELPNPVPGGNQHAWGYPITLQLGASLGEPETRMTLTGPAGEVDCWFTSPNRPLNPDLVPPGASCLIPKQALAANTTYKVEVVFGEERMNWSFTTGK